MSFKVCTDLHANPDFAPRLAVDRDRLWNKGHVFQICFLGGSDIQKNRVIEAANEWLDYANVYFSWNTLGNTNESHIRIDFRRGRGSWSYVGKDALAQTNPAAATMNFGWLYDETDDAEFSRVVLHEFGHMLGAIHEHQSPAAGIQWDKPLLYQYYWQTQSWSNEQVDINIIEKYDGDISNTEFDEESIMLYPVEQRFTLNDFEVGWNTKLSDTDKEFIAECYPRK